MTTGAIVFFSIVAFFAALVLVSTIIDVIVGSRLLESMLVKEKYDKNNATFLSENDDIISDIMDDNEHEMLLDIQKENNNRPAFLQAILGRPTTVERLISDNTFKPSRFQLGLCYTIQFFMCWSAIRNFKNLFYDNPAPEYQRFRFINGIKTLSSLWYVLGM